MVTTIRKIPFITTQLGRSRSSLYNDIQKGVFPPPVSLGERSVGWPEYEINAINSARIAGKTTTQIRELVESLLSARKGISEVHS